MEADRLQELALLHALNALEGEDSRQLQELLAQSNPELAREIRSFNQVASLLAESTLTRPQPPPGLKERLMRAVHSRPQPAPRVPSPLDGLRYIRKDDPNGWRPLATAGAYVKLLSMDEAAGYAVVLGKLEPGARYPAHEHSRSEQIYILSGDLHIGDEVLQAGDFHEAAGGTSHGVNHSEAGCTILAVISTGDLMRQFAAQAP